MISVTRAFERLSPKPCRSASAKSRRSRRTLRAAVLDPKPWLARRFRHLWTLAYECAQGEIPYWSRRAINAWRSYQEKSDLFSRSVFFQSTQGPGIRAAIEALSIPGRNRESSRFSERRPVWGGSGRDLQRRWPGSRQRIRWAGYGSRGYSHTWAFRWPRSKSAPFAAESGAGGPGCPTGSRATRRLWLRYVAGGIPGEEYCRIWEECWSNLPHSNRWLRTRTVLCIHSVATTENARVATAPPCRKTPRLDLLEPLPRRSPSIAPEEAALLESRIWRYAVFLPYLLGDTAAVRRECERSCRLALSIASATAQAAENLYATLETRARILEWLGDYDGAVAAFETLCTRVDPSDAKAWYNFGDMLDRFGLTDRAIVAFARAIKLGQPFMTWRGSAWGGASRTSASWIPP